METPGTGTSADGAVLRTIRRLLLAILTVGLLGTAADLTLLEHYEGVWQAAPLVLIGGALAAVALIVASPSRRALVALQCMMVLFIAAGGLGILLHYIANREFQLEIDPQLGGWDLFLKVITAKAPPALAPAVMIQLGLVGLLSTYKHPAGRHAAVRVESN